MNVHEDSKYIVSIDLSNFNITGRQVAAFRRGLAPSLAAACRYDIQDHTWRPDLKALRSFVAWSGLRRAARIVAYGSSTGSDFGFWRAVQLARMEAVIEPREHGRREKGVDVSLAMGALHDVESCMKPGDEITLVAGDGDYIPLVRRVRERGISVKVMFFSSAAKALKEAASAYVCLDQSLDRLTLTPYTRRRAA